MEFYSPWLLGSDESKSLNVIHDLLHVANSVYVDYAEDCFNRLCPADENPKLRNVIYDESRIRCESMTEDLAKAIYDRFHN